MHLPSTNDPMLLGIDLKCYDLFNIIENVFVYIVKAEPDFRVMFST